jgi:Fe-S cluster assembly scaffold protein SufB
MSRGISQKDARKLIVDGFLEAVIEKISIEKVRTLFSFQ